MPPVQVGIAALSQVLPTSVLRTLSLNTNSLGDEGSETLSKVLSGENEAAWCGGDLKGTLGGIICPSQPFPPLFVRLDD